ncbi:hypothetical protein CIHG_01176 [Coccidioides immitis H538.4]|uniref:Uncharacterized protein n=1 Tax=Coccidioides immitis H538.4 TaxID=396776 RepID=A0A0J8U8K2_COCIT|nr:hypothetical protein CIHG_01176 [Coccidioides immitis H538.4]
MDEEEEEEEEEEESRRADGEGGLYLAVAGVAGGCWASHSCCCAAAPATAEPPRSVNSRFVDAFPFCDSSVNNARPLQAKPYGFQPHAAGQSPPSAVFHMILAAAAVQLESFSLEFRSSRGEMTPAVHLSIPLVLAASSCACRSGLSIPRLLLPPCCVAVQPLIFARNQVWCLVGP